MKGSSPLVLLHETQRTVIAESSYYGQRTVDLCGPFRRLYSDGAEAPPLLEQYVDVHRVDALPMPSELLQRLPSGDTTLGQSARSLARLHALLLLTEDPQERLVGRGAITLAHQASLVRHVLESPDLRRVLLADEVGLGKTIEAGLILKALLDQQPGLRILYLAPARLVRNVYQEFRSKLDLNFRQYSADERSQADIRSDPLIVASIHRAVHPANRARVLATDPWDVIVVDECHHVSATGENGQHANEHYDLVRELIDKQATDGRLLLMSGTPHQGSRTRFDNLVSLLLRKGEPRSAIGGRVIFRTKDDVLDWHGEPLFPRRDVRPATIVRLGGAYQQWYEGIARLYDDVSGSVARKRASGWAKSQALQWAASSVNAGLGFLARLAIRRLGWNLENTALRNAVLALRPYKGGKADQRAEEVFSRMTSEIIRQTSDRDIDDMEEISEESWKPSASDIARLLNEGTALLSSNAAGEKWRALRDLLDEAPNEKVVMFAQPVETVAALMTFLEKEYGRRPAVIIGGQSDDERDREIDAFRRPDGPRLLVSSRAGGEGLNLQVARRLVHVDVPWNPMELEQRVGRVHRFGSRQTIIVSTLVVFGTREVDAYRVAREKLSTAFGDLSHDPERFETLFSRVMALIPPQELEEILGHSAPGPISESDSQRLGALIDEGLRRWRDFHDSFSAEKQSIEAMDPGSATWDDLADFLVQHSDAETVTGCTAASFTSVEDEIIVSNAPVRALKIEGRVFTCADLQGAVASDGSGHPVPSLGTNTPVVAEILRASVLAATPTGAAWVRSSPALMDVLKSIEVSTPFGVLVLARQTIRTSKGSATELKTRLVTHVMSATGEATELDANNAAKVLRLLIASQRQREPQSDSVWPERLDAAERDLLPLLGRPSAEELENGIRHAVWPMFAGVIT
ncbi:hypothetical protein BH09GEM1_BH09GEM1_42430 [soil metagenome]